jgi:hypothetical protein
LDDTSKQRLNLFQAVSKKKEKKRKEKKKAPTSNKEIKDIYKK